MPFSLYIYSRCFRLSCVSILNIFFPLFEATFQIIFTLKTKICFNQFVCTHQIYKSTWHWFNNKQPYRLALTRFVIWQDLLFDKQVVSTIFAASLQISSCSKSDFHRLDPTWCVQQTCYKLLEQTCQDLLSTSLMQVVSTTCSKSTNIKLQQVWFSQLASTLMRSTGLLQVVLSDLSRLVVHKLAASCYNNLQQVCKYQVAASLILQTCCNLMKSTDLLQLVDNLQQVGKIHNLQQVCGVSGCVVCLCAHWSLYETTHWIGPPMVDIVRIVTRLFQQGCYNHDITILLQPCVVNLVTFLLYHDCIRLVRTTL